MTRKNPQNPRIRESIADLKIAVRALMANAAENPDSRDDCSWFINSLKDKIATQFAFDAAMREGTITKEIDAKLNEAGARFSATTRAALASVRDSIAILIEPSAPEATDAADDEDVAELFGAIGELVEAFKPFAKKEDTKADGTDPAEPDDDDAPKKKAAKGAVAEGTNTTDAARTKHPGIGGSTGATVSESTVPDIREITILPAGVKPIAYTPATFLRESTDGDGKGNQFDMLIIKEGMSKNRVMYRGEVLQRSLPLLEGRPIYVDHPSQSSPDRSLSRKVGWWDNVRMAEVDGTKCIVGRANIMENSGQSWFLPMVREAIDRGHPEMIGISILAGGETVIKRDGAGAYKEVLEVQVYASADAVSEPGAGGRPLSLAASEGEDFELKTLQECKTLAEVFEALPNMTIAEIRTARPDLFEADGTPKLAPVVEAAKPDDKIAEDAPKLTAEMTALTESMNEMKRATTQSILDRKLSASGMPKAVQDRIRTRVGDAIMAESAITDLIQEFADVINDARTPSDVGMSGASWVVPYGSMKVGKTIAEQLQLAADEWFGAPIADEDKGKFQSIRSMREYYMAVTGDRDFRGQYNAQYSVVAEALPTAAHVVGGATVTMSQLLGTSMNKALVAQYQNQPKWWDPIVTRSNLDDMKQQDRIRLVSFGSLTQRTVDGAEYTELTWGDNDEHYTPTEYGNIVTVGRRAIINDDLKGVQRLPQLLTQSAILTLNEFVSALFTANSGNGPAMGDGVDVFDAASHQGNRVTTALNRSNLIALMKVIMKMQNDAGKVIGIIPRTLLTPIDLWDTAYELIQTQFVPDSANNAKNIIGDQAAGGLTRAITVPNWTDANNWYLMADPAQLTSIELGFLFGREEPELLSQQDPTSGMVWTNDVISYKVRHDYGAAWLDYRGAAAAIVA